MSNVIQCSPLETRLGKNPHPSSFRQLAELIFRQLQEWGPLLPVGWRLEAACWLQSHSHRQSSKENLKRESVNKEASHSCNAVREVPAHPLCHIPLIRSKSQVLLTLRERGSHKGMNTIKGESWEVTVESVHHKNNKSARRMVQIPGATGAQKECSFQQMCRLHMQRWYHHCELIPFKCLDAPISIWDGEPHNRQWGKWN